MSSRSVSLAAAIFAAALVTPAFALPKPVAPGAPVATPAEAPTPLVVVPPTHLPRSFTGGVVQIEFTLDAAGRPRDIRLPGVYDGQLQREIVRAFSQWQFAPAASRTRGSAVRFVLPLEVRTQP